MKRIYILVLFCCFFLLALPSAPWKGGYEIAFSGYDHEQMSDNNTFSARLNVLLAQSPYGQARFSVGGNLSNPRYAPVDRYIDTSLSYSLQVARTTFLADFLIRDAAWYMSLEAGLLIPPQTIDETKAYLSFSPLILYFGDKLVSVASPILVYDVSSQTMGWGVSLVRITHMLW
ncbi:MAG: hypothetical protein JXK93_09445 [Sphaerochaetaceae bacterium]|nr:hypothetical protein [Sphaerochaetaceae bacterium]